MAIGRPDNSGKESLDVHSKTTDKTPAIDIAALLDLPNLQQRLAAHMEWLVQVTTEAGFENAREGVEKDVRADPWAFLMDFAQGMAGKPVACVQ